MTKEELKDTLETIYQKGELIIKHAPTPIIELSTGLYRLAFEHRKFIGLEGTLPNLRYKGLPVFEMEIEEQAVLLRDATDKGKRTFLQDHLLIGTQIEYNGRSNN